MLQQEASGNADWTISLLVSSSSSTITSFNVNFVILHAKWFIHCNRESNNNVNFDHFMKYLKNVIEIEKHIAVSNGTLRNYSKTLENLLQN